MPRLPFNFAPERFVTRDPPGLAERLAGLRGFVLGAFATAALALPAQASSLFGFGFY
jgi:hypothetical protein